MGLRNCAELWFKSFFKACSGIYKKQPHAEPEPGDPHRSHVKVLLNHKHQVKQKPLWSLTSAFMILLSTK